jgi:hypothetical protein
VCEWYTLLVKEEYTRNPNTVCLQCSKAIYRRPSQIKRGSVFCNSTCYGTAIRKINACLVCGTSILARENKKTCSRSCSNTHRAGIKYKIGRPKDNATTFRRIKIKLMTERGAQCERCGYSKQEILHVHHRDRNRNNNDFSNLEIVCPNCHYEEHYLEKTLSDTLLP